MEKAIILMFQELKTICLYNHECQFKSKNIKQL